MLAILRDAAARPELFSWFGAIADHEIDHWLRQINRAAPDDVRELWAITGGGDFFDEGETLLRPTALRSLEPYFIDNTDFVDAVSQHWISTGMPTDLLPFHNGSFQSAIRTTDQRIVTLDSGWSVIKEFSGLDDWYLATLRRDYADVYRFRMN